MRCQKMFFSQLLCRLRPLGIILIILIALCNADNAVNNIDGMWQPGEEDEDTVHEKLGQAHFPVVSYEEYVSHVQYSDPRIFPSMGMDSIFNFTHDVSNVFHPHNGSYMLPDYVVHTNKSAFNIGKKYEENDFAELLKENIAVIFLWILPLIFLAIIMPFIAVIYCCFCCWRCKNTCGPCNKPSASRRLLCSILLFLLILALLLAFLLALMSVKQMSRNEGVTKDRMRDAAKDTCTYLQDVSEHLRYLMITNFEKLNKHIEDELSIAHNHVALDLTDASGANALEELERLFKNMRPVLRLFRILEQTDKQLHFLAALHRDSWRGIKRDLVFNLATICHVHQCLPELRKYQRLDTSICLHIDDMPNTTKFITPVEDAIKKELVDTVYRGHERLNAVKEIIRQAIEPIVPPIKVLLERSAGTMYDEYVMLNDIIDSTINEIHMRGENSANTFDDINERFGANRRTLDIIACVLLFLILMALIFGLIFGLCGRRTTTGSYCLLIAILLIFCVYTFITLMGLFYYVLGTVTYQAVCRRLDHLGDYESHSEQKLDGISACKPDQHIYDLLENYKLYDVGRILSNDANGPISADSIKWFKFEGDLSQFHIFNLEEIGLINSTLFDLYPYIGTLYTKITCKELRTPLTNVASDIYDFIYHHIYLWGNPGCPDRFLPICMNTHMAAMDARLALRQDIKIIRCIDAIKETTTKIDFLLSTKHLTFGQVVTQLLDKIALCEKFIKKRGLIYINTIGNNLTESLKDRIDDYRTYTQTQIRYKVGPCRALNYHIDRGTTAACRQLVDPINGFWIALLLSSLLFLPLLFVAHKLICLYRPHSAKPVILYLDRNTGCPTCTGAPFPQPPIVICSGGQEKDWDDIDVESVDKNKQD